MRRPELRRALAGRRRRRIAAALALLTTVAVVVGIVAGVGSSSPKPTGANSGTATGATTVQRRDLVETDTESGTLSYANPQTVYNRLSGTITWLPDVGNVIKPGQALFKVGGQPVVLMNGTTPAYRDLSASDTAGQDILELNRNLVRLGFNPDGITINDTWQAATTAGVETLQASLGETETGSLSLGKVVFLPADQLVSTVDATLGSTGGSSNQANPSSSTNASDRQATGRPEFVSLPTAGTTTTTPPTTTTTTPPATTPKPTKPKAPKPGSSHKPGGQNKLKTLEALIALLKAEIAELNAKRNQPGGSPSSSTGGNRSPSNSGSPSSSNSGSPSSSNSGSPSSSNSGSPSSSNGGSPSSSNSGSPSSSRSGTPSSNSGSPSGNSGGASPVAILHTTSTRLTVTVDLDASKQSEAKVGERVTVVMPAGNTVDGRISAVSPVAQSSSSSNNGNGSNNGNSSNGSNNNNGSNGSSGSTIPVTITLSSHHTGAGLDQAAVSVNFAQARAHNVLSVPVTALLATAGGGYAVQAGAAPHNLIPVRTGLFAAGYVQVSGAGIYQGLQVTDSQG